MRWKVHQNHTSLESGRNNDDGDEGDAAVTDTGANYYNDNTDNTNIDAETIIAGNYDNGSNNDDM